MIRLQGIHKFFNKGRSNEIHVLNDVSLEFPQTGMVAIFGKSGCGKTTLLNVIGGLDGFHRGSLTLDDRSITENTDELRNRYVGYIFQNYNLNKSETCFENVADALRLCGVTDKTEIEARVMAALRNVDMANYRARTPDTLSGGQQQRIAIARAIVKNPHIILADEPTGNLDEANTLHIMNLLREIARDRLVLLVTHEANLVDYYCDTVIELRDGKVESVRQNENASGYLAKDKNRIYLGELERTHATAANAEIEYFGPKPSEPIRIRIVNNGGRLYLKLENQEVQILDATSEIKLCEGEFKQNAPQAHSDTTVDMTALPPLEAGRCGKLFSFLSSVKSGYLANFHKRRKGKKLLLSCMVLFSAVFVLMTAIFGTAFGQVESIQRGYNHNVFYVYTPSGEISSRLLAALENPESGVDSVRLTPVRNPGGDRGLRFQAGYFESFQMTSSGTLRANGAVLDVSLVANAELLAGRKTDLAADEVLITSTVADMLLETSSLGYLSEYNDLIGLILTNLTVNGRTMRLAGVVRSEETAVYLTEPAIAELTLSNAGLNVKPASLYGKTVENGKALFYTFIDDSGNPKVNTTVPIHGMSFLVERVSILNYDYEGWRVSNGHPSIEQLAEDYFKQLAAERYPELSAKEQEETIGDLMETDYYRFLLEVYYAQADAFLEEVSLLRGDQIEIWLYREKNAKELLYYILGDDYAYRASKFYERNGRYPTQFECSAESSGIEDLKPLFESYIRLYEEEFYRGNSKESFQRLYLVSDADYSALSRQYGDTHRTAMGRFFGGYEKEYAVEKGIGSETVLVETVENGNDLYTTLHSTDPARTEQWLRESFSDLKAPFPYMKPLITPTSIYEEHMHEYKSAVTVSLITLGILLGVLCVCMYFIMRSALMNRVKEVGIYRAIGVSKRNLIFRFFIEALVLTSLTVLPGYLAISGLLTMWLSSSSLVSTIFYYPVWIALADLILLGGVCLLCGTLPILSLLRKTPSQILAQYDI
ncbi:MAG: ABC transporter ATP-binding protein/permease [Ruminococcaceae bacterium]|nr:ABC transporter ATP-binding protein/permease [Oscillospiraceae bacterium]